MRKINVKMNLYCVNICKHENPQESFHGDSHQLVLTLKTDTGFQSTGENRPTLHWTSS
jgi:hypothetical protein